METPLPGKHEVSDLDGECNGFVGLFHCAGRFILLWVAGFGRISGQAESYGFHLSKLRGDTLAKVNQVAKVVNESEGNRG